MLLMLQGVHERHWPISRTNNPNRRAAILYTADDAALTIAAAVVAAMAAAASSPHIMVLGVRRWQRGLMAALAAAVVAGPCC